MNELSSAPGGPRLTAEQRGNVTDAHRRALARLSVDRESSWATSALWACLAELGHSTVTSAAEVRVEQAWVDGPDAFCVVYRVGWRRYAELRLQEFLTDLLDVRDLRWKPQAAEALTWVGDGAGGMLTGEHGTAKPLSQSIGVSATLPTRGRQQEAGSKDDSRFHER